MRSNFLHCYYMITMDKSLFFKGYLVSDKMPKHNQNILIKAQGIDDIAPAVYEEYVDEDGNTHHLFKDPYYGQSQVFAIEDVIEWYENSNF